MKGIIVGIIIGVIFIAPMIQDPASAIAIGKIIASKVLSVGVPIVKQVIKDATTGFIGGISLEQIIGGVN